MGGATCVGLMLKLPFEVNLALTISAFLANTCFRSFSLKRKFLSLILFTVCSLEKSGILALVSAINRLF